MRDVPVAVSEAPDVFLVTLAPLGIGVLEPDGVRFLKEERGNLLLVKHASSDQCMTLITQREKNFTEHLLKMKTCSTTLNITVSIKHNDSTYCLEINKYMGQTNWLQLKFPLGQCLINTILPPYYENRGVLPFPLHLQ